MHNVTFRNGGITMAGQVFLPPGFDARAHTKHAALVCVHPGSGVKEQTAGLYARQMASKGFVTLAFDASGQGESGGEPRHAEVPAARVEDIRCAVDFLTTLDHVDESKIGVLGICAGGGYAVNAAMTDHRIRAVGVVAAVNIGRARRAGGPDSVAEMLEAVGRQRTLEARGGAPLITRWIPDSPQEAAAAGVTEPDALEAVDYYRTPRGRHPRSDNRLRFTSVADVIGFDAFHLVEELLTQPLQVIVGSEAGEFGSYQEGVDLYRRAPGRKDLHVIDGASHYDLYDRPAYVGQAVTRLESFYAEALSLQPHSA
ncbi:alpha/beta hydrolase [Streptomyces minutiscleroticus]|uniref:Alpha/beta hydrolase n=1 Tax=Streptomyces minutiscleroticus TaxID=68238 RepID=A0A918NXL9_9ACTN|nr:alpha/beta hydrolase [Streptomyces minutiscleroticus]GGY04544.1 alpha/beta hydrolase [Streptomyces minutiscleroticus]